MLITRLLRILDAYLESLFFGESTPSPEARESVGQQNAATPGGRKHQPDLDPELAGYYANLEVPYGSDLDTVRQAWKKLLRKYHPDLHSTDPEKRRIATELTQGLNHAYRELEKRLGGRD